MTATVVLVLRLALAIALYAFLAWALIALWQDLKAQGNRLASQKKTGITIVQKSARGKDREFHFFQNDVVIGRHANCDIALMDEIVSAQHARLTYHHNQWWLEDLGSTNATFLNGMKLNIPAVVITGDEFRCGTTDFAIRIDQEDSPLTNQ
ncbi:MAG: FHA domain-containing protein [Anaerolineales bacterium]|nr:FHA domain-containing protein [Anaerolineales bacterium]